LYVVAVLLHECSMIKYISHCRVLAPVSAGYFLFKHFVAYSKAQITYTQKHNTKDILQVIKGWYSANTYITPKKNFLNIKQTHMGWWYI